LRVIGMMNFTANIIFFELLGEDKRKST